MPRLLTAMYALTLGMTAVALGQGLRSQAPQPHVESPALPEHTCCYSDYETVNTYPWCSTCQCQYGQTIYRHWKEYGPTPEGTTDPYHAHKWYSGTYQVSDTGPHRYPNCDGP